MIAQQLAVRADLCAVSLPADPAARIEPDFAAVRRLKDLGRRTHLRAHRRRVVHAGLEAAAVADAAGEEKSQEISKKPHPE
jgi:hypothetical protein